ncbi:MAG: hypothetical protein O2780_02025 [Proteobacteria bacterium]|jgi:hypothetical protein|nr:hypothetical protein [Pseudomonadota bacterium]MDA1302080.1 hypothetical protein [Pseudomonadota bacterium]
MSETAQHFVICIRNDEYPASLETRKIYASIPDLDAGKHGQIRVVDESGEDYLYPSDFFIPIDLPREAEQAVIAAA